jgi:nucleoid-associated protein YgaU
MAIYTSTSRYQLTDNGTTAERKESSETAYVQYITKEGDTFERIAAKLFNDGTRYWEIAEINPQIYFPDELPVGTLVRLPR